MQTFFRYLQRFAPMLMCALPVATGNGLTGFREFYFARKAYLESPAAETLPVILAVLRGL